MKIYFYLTKLRQKVQEHVKISTNGIVYSFRVEPNFKLTYMLQLKLFYYEVLITN